MGESSNDEAGGDDSDSSDLASCKLNNDDFDFDSYLRSTLGEFGRYQQFIVCFLCIPACFLSAYSTLDLVFISYTPDHKCNVSESIQQIDGQFGWGYGNDLYSNESSITYVAQECDYLVNVLNGSRNDSFKEKCVSWNYDREYFDQTIITKWNLVCDRALTARTILSILNVASLVAAMYSYIQDRWGRKRAFLLNLTIFLVGGCSALMAPTPLIFTLLKFLGSITCMWEICYCWALEFVGPSQRTALTTMMSVIYGVATMSLALLAYLCDTWVELSLCTTAPFVLLFTYAYFVPESPRWLLTQGRVDEALAIIKVMARWQNVKIDMVALRERVTASRKSTEMFITKSASSSMDKEYGDTETAVVTMSIKEFFASSNLRWKTCLLTFISVVSNQLYTAIPYTVENLGANFYLSYVLQTAVEAPATLLNLFLLNRFGRVLPLSASLLLSGLCCLLTWPMQSFGPWGAVVMAAGSRFFICTGVAIAEQLGGELYPTVARGIGLGFSFAVSSIVAITTQYIIHLTHIWDVMPLLIMGSFTLCAGALALFLPETMGKSMPDSVSQAESQGAVGWKALKTHFHIFRCKKTLPYFKPQLDCVYPTKA